MRFRQCADLRSGAQRIRTRPTSLNYPGQAKPYPSTELLCRFTSCSARTFAKSDDAHPSIHPSIHAKLWKPTTYLYHPELLLTGPTRFPHTCIQLPFQTSVRSNQVSNTRALGSLVFSKELRLQSDFVPDFLSRKRVYLFLLGPLFFKTLAVPRPPLLFCDAAFWLWE